MCAERVLPHSTRPLSAHRPSVSVTFEPAITVIDSWVGVCRCGENRSVLAYPTREEARAHAPICADEFCAAFPGSATPAEQSPFLNVANGNAVHLLSILGYETAEELCGSADAEDFLGRVLVALAINPTDAGVPATQNGSIIDCGRREGYTDDRLTHLRTVAEAAREHGVNVQWA